MNRKQPTSIWDEQTTEQRIYTAVSLLIIVAVTLAPIIASALL